MNCQKVGPGEEGKANLVWYRARGGRGRLGEYFTRVHGMRYLESEELKVFDPGPERAQYRLAEKRGGPGGVRKEGAAG